MQLKFKEIYCHSCKKSIGKYNVKYYSDARIAELLKAGSNPHVREGHQISIRVLG